MRDQLLGELVAVHQRQAKIEQRGVRREGTGRFERGGAVEGNARVDIVVDDEDAAARPGQRAGTATLKPRVERRARPPEGEPSSDIDVLTDRRHRPDENDADLLRLPVGNAPC